LSDEALRTTNERIALIQQQRDIVFTFLQRSPLIAQVWRSDANFLLAQALDVQKIHHRCAQHGIALRSMEHQLPNCLRISIGSPEENNRLMQALAE
jgi:histidinol-phosphate aminotransferase